MQQANLSEYDENVSVLGPNDQPEGQDNPAVARRDDENSESSPIEINWLNQELNNELLPHIKGSSFLELLSLSYFLGADEHLNRHRDQSQQSISPLLQGLLSRLGYAREDSDILTNCRRMLSNNSLLQQFYHDGQYALSCHLAREAHIQTSLQQLVSQFAHYSLMDLNQFNATPYNPQPQSQFHYLERSDDKEKTNAISYIMAFLLFLLISSGGSYLLLRYWFPEILNSVLK